MHSQLPSQLRLLFVCMGNTCRSPMAAAFAVRLFGKKALVASAGIAVTGITPSLHAITVLKNNYGIDISGHCPQPVQDLNIDEFDHIIALDSYIGVFLTDYYPSIAAKLHVWNIADPYGNTEAEYATCAADILSSLNIWCTEAGVLPK